MGNVPALIVIVGLIASGKSTVADALGRRFRSSGREVAVLDLDDLVETLGGFVGLPGERFLRSQLVFATLVGAWLEQGFDVIAHGPFFQTEEIEALVHAVPENVTPRWVLLHSAFEVALERVADDPDRTLSSSPDFLKATYDRVADLLPSMPSSEWSFDTTTTDADTIVDHLAEALLT